MMCNAIESTNSLDNVSFKEVMSKKEVHDPFYDSCDLGEISCASQMKACIGWLSSKRSTLSVETKEVQCKKKRCLSEVKQMWLRKGLVDLMKILHLDDKLSIRSIIFKPFTKKKKSKAKSRSYLRSLSE